MNAGRIAVHIAGTLMKQAVKERRERFFLAKGLHEVRTHGFHEDQHHVAFAQSRICRQKFILQRSFLRSLALQHFLHVLQGLRLIHQTQAHILRTEIVERTGQQIECRIHPQLVQECVLAIVGRAHLDGIVAPAPSDTEKTQPYAASAQKQNRDSAHPGLGRFGQDKSANPFVAKPDKGSQKYHKCKHGRII